MLYIENLSKRFGNHIIIDKLNQNFSTGCHIIEGQNGSGKTTLLILIAGLARSDSGEVYIDCEDEKKRTFLVSKYGTYVPDKPDFYAFMTGEEYIQFVQKSRAYRKADFEHYIKELSLEKFLNLTFSEMSLGTKKKLFLAVGLSLESNVILLDEPTVGLDRSSIGTLETILQSLSKQHVILLSTHNQQFLKNSRMSVLKLMEKGKTDREYRTDSQAGASG